MLQHTLIVDDSLPHHKIIRAHLEEEGLEFHSAYDGVTALSMATKVRPSLILLDVDMPDMDGFEVCRRLKADAGTAGIPIIFLTSDFSSHDKVKALELGAVDYVTKPFNPRELSARVGVALRAKRLLEQKTMVDGLTGLWNDQYLAGYLKTQMTSAGRSGRPLSCILADVDGLQRINQKFGAPMGDEILRSLGSLFRSQCRAEDAVCRCDGGKFAVVMSAMNRAGAGRLADRLCADVEKQFLVRGGHEVGVTCSFGVADSLVSTDSSVMERAELALVRAKQKGGCCVSIARPPRRDLSPAA